MRMEELFCKKCGLATMQLHPSATPFKENMYNNLYKCNFCGYVIDITTSKEKAEKLKRREAIGD